MALKINQSILISDLLMAEMNETYVKSLTVSERVPNATGVTYGYASGGQPSPPAPPLALNTIDRFPFTTPFATATDLADLSGTTEYAAGVSSDVDGYSVGGIEGTTNQSFISKFPFSTPFTTGLTVGNLEIGKGNSAGHSSYTNGYSAGGLLGPAPSPRTNRIDTFPFSTAFTTASDVGDLSETRDLVTGQSSGINGYSSGGAVPSVTNRVDRFPFSTPFITATNVGSLSLSRSATGGINSSTNGYNSGGATPSSNPPTFSTNTIDRFPFASPFVGATDIGDLFQSRREASGQSSTTEGYTSGGGPPLGTILNTIDKFPFSTPFGTATDVGDLFIRKNGTAGHQD